MKRAAIELERTKREHRKHLRSHGWPKKIITCPCDTQANRFRKTDAFDCGQTNCRICNYERWLNGSHVETRQEILFDFKMKEQLREIK